MTEDDERRTKKGKRFKPGKSGVVVYTIFPLAPRVLGGAVKV
ncbi:MAG: hypothetical protein NZT92_20730 [Abditibacteriales bacterium]|nr:hypothetical protein [Abditibacteriales bacterium]MDW8368138.1 hypothetical protein [Abditibacteriales bacterium]